MNFPDFCFEKRLHKKGYQYIIGVDEVGRGCLAGPVVVAAVIFPSGLYKQKGPLTLNCKQKLLTVDDSKRLTSDKRELLSLEIKKIALTYDITEISVAVINRIGISKAVMKGMRKTIKDVRRKVEVMDNGKWIREKSKEKKLKNLSEENPKSQVEALANNTRRYYVLVDYFNIPYLPKFGKKNQKGITKGDQRSISIAAASVIAKVYRDGLMKRLAKKKNYRKYCWEKNKGYGTLDHTKAIKKYGLTRYSHLKTKCQIL